MKFVSLIIVFFCLPLWGSSNLAQSDPLWETSWKNPEFISKFTGSFGFDGEREPSINRQEQQLFEEIALLASEENYSAAINRLQQNIGPESSAALDFTLGNFYFQSGQLAAAEAQYRAALKKFPNFLRAQKNLGLTLMQAGRFAAARPWLLAAIEGEGADGPVYGMLAYVYFMDERYPSALQAYEQALLHQPDNREWQIGRAQCLYATHQPGQAAAVLEELIEQQPERPDLWLMQANAWLALEQSERAAANIEVVRRMGAAPPAALMLLGDIYLSQDMPELATGSYLAALAAKSPPRPEKSLQAASLLVNRQAWESAERLVRAIEAAHQGTLEPTQATALLNLNAQIAMARGQEDEAARILRSLLERDPLNGRALLVLADYEWQEGRPEEAELLYERAARVPEFAVEAYVEQARLHVTRQDYREAIGLLEKAQSIEPQKNVARYLDQVRQAASSVGQ